MNAIVPQSLGQVAAVFQGQAVENDLAEGIQASFGLIGFRGKVWSIKYRGDETKLMRDDGDGPRGSIEAVIVQAAKNISKVWYEAGYVEGSTAPPDCFSNNGLTPDPASPKKQAMTCAACPKNAFGSSATGKGKACSDSKRLAVVPLGDIQNEVYGGPMLLRVPAASLNDLAHFGTKMSQLGYQYYAIGTRIQFDAKEAYPKFVFSGIRVLTNEEGAMIAALRNSPAVERILSEGNGVAPDMVQPTKNALESAFEQPPATAAPQAATAVQQAPQPVQQAPQPAPTPAPQPVAQPAPTPPAPAPQPAPQPVKASGFGPAAPVTPEVTPAQAAPATAPTADEFEAGLDAMIGKLLPAAA